MAKFLRVNAALGALLFAVTLGMASSPAQVVEQNYADRLMRLAEILGAIHHLRDICGANEGQLWRDEMMALLEAEDPPGQFRARLIAAFNNGYRGFQRTYSSCTTSAKTAADRFLAEGSEIATSLTVTLAAPASGAEAGTDERGSSGD